MNPIENNSIKQISQKGERHNKKTCSAESTTKIVEENLRNIKELKEGVKPKHEKKSCFGPKICLKRPVSKGNIKEDIPFPEENSKNPLRCFEIHTLSEIIEERKNLQSFTMRNFYLTNTSQINKEEDEFWKMERKDSIINKHFSKKNPNGIKIFSQKDAEFEHNQIFDKKSILKKKKENGFDLKMKKKVRFSHKQFFLNQFNKED